MEDYDYVMMVDENGSPYLAHVDWGKARQTVRNAASSAKNAVKSAGQKSYKYYQKLKEGGKTLYFYSPEELKAHYDNLRRQASGAVDKAKKTAANVRDNAQVAMTSARRKADDLRGKAAQTAAKARQTADNMRSEFTRRADQVGAAANNAVASVKDRAGVDERERRDAAKKAADEAQARYDSAQEQLDEAHELRADARRNGGAGLSRAEELVREAAREREAARKDNEAKQKAYRDAQAEYDATALGKVDRAGEAVGNVASNAHDIAGRAIDSAQEGARKAIDASKSKFDRMKDDFAKKAGQAKEAAGNAADKVKEAAGNAADKVKDTVDAAKQSYDKISKEANDLISEVKNNVYNKMGGDLEKRIIDAQDAAIPLSKEYNQAYDKLGKDEINLFQAERNVEFKKSKVDTAFNEYSDHFYDTDSSKYQKAYHDAFDEYSAALDKYDAALDTAIASDNAFRKIEDRYVKQIDKIRGLQNEYDSSLVGRAKKAKGTIDTAVDSARESIGRAASDTREAFDAARETVSNAANSARETAGRAISSVKDRAGVDERERRDAAKKAADEAQSRYESAQDRLDEAHELRADAKRNGGAGLSRAEELVREAAREREAARKDNEAKQKAYREAQSEYDATALGKGDRAGEATSRAASEAVSGIREVWNKLSAGKTLTKKDREILNEYNRQNR